VLLGTVDVGPGRSVEDDVGPVVEAPVRDVEVSPCASVGIGKDLAES
jgi:hypothetical protein